ncbi:hypothetical protein DOY81_012804 [Sarcophaga bullata]|nr:hypothetical protein DOY81_012804 [Sarcophaga bullata]
MDSDEILIEEDKSRSMLSDYEHPEYKNAQKRERECTEMDIDELLIEEIKNRSILYDYDTQNTKNKKRRENEWTEIAVILNMAGKCFYKLECKRRWKVLRDHYMRSKRREAASGSGAKASKWKYSDAISFLDKVIGVRRCNPPSDWRTDSMDPLSHTFQSPTTSSPREKDLLPQTFQISTTSSQRGKKRKFSDEFEAFNDLTESNTSENCQTELSPPQVQDPTEKLDSIQVQVQAQDTTTTHFAVLAAKIREANMPPYVVNRIEAHVSALVFGEIESFYSTANKTM